MRLIGPPILRECLKPQPPHPTVKSHIPPPQTQPLTAPQNPCTHLFFRLNPETRPETLTLLIKQSWQYDPLTTLKLICYSRTLRVRGDSISCNEGFHVAAIWLHKNHPLTLACNLRKFAGFGSLRDFSHILYRLVHDDDDHDDDNHHHHHHHHETEKMVIARKAVCKYAKDSTYRFLHDRVSDIFADLLRSDYETLNNGNDVESLSFAARECPSIDSSCDRHTLLCESIAKKVFPRGSDPCYKGLEDEHYVYRVRSRLRKEVLGPLRSALEKEEAQRKQRVSNSTFFFMKKAYQKMLKMKENAPTKQRYYRILLSMILKANDQNLPSTPPCVIASLTEENKGMKELEWQNMVQSFSSNRKLRNSVAVCDILDGTIYAFHKSPKLCKIEGDDLQSKVNFMKQIKCTESVNIETVLNQVLQVGASQKLEKEKMVERVFVFTNKEFKKAVDNCWGWNYRAVWENYQKFGYDQVPEVVFWNVEGFIDRPPRIRTAIYNTMVIINGFSRGLFAFFLDVNALLGSEEIRSITTAEDVMRITLSGKEYQNIAVLD